MGYIEKVRQKFVYTGDSTADAVDRFLAVRAVTAIAAVAVFLCFFVLGITPFEGMANTAVGALLVLVLAVGPDAKLNRRIEARQHEIQLQLPAQRRPELLLHLSRRPGLSAFANKKRGKP